MRRGWTRRGVLGGGAAMALGCGGRRAPPRLEGGVLGPDLAERGHRLRSPFSPPAEAPAEVADVVIVGAGVAGLSAAWRLQRAGFRGAVQILELADQEGGTAAWGEGAAGPFALGAHYLTLPSREAAHMRALLADLGVITSFDADGRPFFDESMLCLAPGERIYAAGEWIEGLWPEPLADAEARAQLADLLATLDGLKRAVGSDGRPVFSIPTARSSRDPAHRALAEQRYSDWLDAAGYTSPALRWWAEYATRDDYGTSLADTSAWAGLHYHCARRPDPADPTDMGTDVLTWPEGNGWLIEALLARVPWRPLTGALVRQIEPEAGGARVWWEREGQVHGTRASAVIAAVPCRVLDRLTPRPEGPRPDMSPWRVVALTVDQPPASRGVPLAWDSVIYGAESLGYVSSAHQRGRYGGPTVLSWYQPLAEGAPAARRQALLSARWEEEVEATLTELEAAHPDIRARVQRADVMRWGHGTVRPTPGLHAIGALDPLSAPSGAVFPAHTDNSGLSLFEEASWHGVRAAEEVLAALGAPTGPRLADPEGA